MGEVISLNIWWGADRWHLIQLLNNQWLNTKNIDDNQIEIDFQIASNIHFI